MNAIALPPGQVVVIDRYVGQHICRKILQDLEFVWWSPSQTVTRDRNGQLTARQSICRTSRTSGEDWLSAPIRRDIRRLELKLAEQFGIEPAFLEPWQIVRYRRGELFDEHHDAGLFAERPHGERVATFILYLDDQPGTAGATSFPSLRRRIVARAGRLVTWRNLLDDGAIDPSMTHSGAPARRTKTLLTTWLRQCSVRSRPRKEDAYASAET
jgi:prolyl 4-hydroxylase